MSEPNVAPIPRALILERSEGCTSEDEIYTLSFHNLGLTSMRGLDRCVKLRSLDLSFNALQTAEGLPPLPDLRELKLYCNRLVSISGLTKLPSLTTLLLQSNRLQPPDLSAPPPLSLSGLPNLSFLRIDSNPALGDTGVAALCLAGLPKLTELDASGTGLTSLEAMRGLAPTLETLRLDRNGLGRVPIRGASACSSMGGGGGACGGGNAGGSDALARVPARGASACSEERGGGASGGGGGACRGGGGTGGSSLASSPDAGGGGQTGVGVKGRGVAEGGKAGGGVAGSSVAGSPLCAPLLAISSLKGLTDLHLGWNALHDDSLAAMRGVALTLTCLKLNDNRLATLHALPALPALTELDLARNLISALGAFGMAEIPAGGGKGAGGREAAAVPAGGGSRGGRGSAGARGRAPMALAGNPPSRLRPGAPPVGIATAKAAGSGDAGGGGGEARPSCPPFPCLQVLDLSHNQLLLTCTAGGETLRPLRRAALPALCELSLAGNPGADTTPNAADIRSLLLAARFPPELSLDGVSLRHLPPTGLPPPRRPLSARPNTGGGGAGSSPRPNTGRGEAVFDPRHAALRPASGPRQGPVGYNTGGGRGCGASGGRAPATPGHMSAAARPATPGAAAAPPGGIPLVRPPSSRGGAPLAVRDETKVAFARQALLDRFARTRARVAAATAGTAVALASGHVTVAWGGGGDVSGVDDSGTGVGGRGVGGGGGEVGWRGEARVGGRRGRERAERGDSYGHGAVDGYGDEAEAEAALSLAHAEVEAMVALDIEGGEGEGQEGQQTGASLLSQGDGGGLQPRAVDGDRLAAACSSCAPPAQPAARAQIWTLSDEADVTDEDDVTDGGDVTEGGALVSDEADVVDGADRAGHAYAAHRGAVTYRAHTADVTDSGAPRGVLPGVAAVAGACGGCGAGDNPLRERAGGAPFGGLRARTGGSSAGVGEAVRAEQKGVSARGGYAGALAGGEGEAGGRAGRSGADAGEGATGIPVEGAGNGISAGGAEMPAELVEALRRSEAILTAKLGAARMQIPEGGAARSSIPVGGTTRSRIPEGGAAPPPTTKRRAASASAGGDGSTLSERSGSSGRARMEQTRCFSATSSDSPLALNYSLALDPLGTPALMEGWRGTDQQREPTRDLCELMGECEYNGGRECNGDSTAASSAPQVVGPRQGADGQAVVASRRPGAGTCARANGCATGDGGAGERVRGGHGVPVRQPAPVAEEGGEGVEGVEAAEGGEGAEGADRMVGAAGGFEAAEGLAPSPLVSAVPRSMAESKQVEGTKAREGSVGLAVPRGVYTVPRTMAEWVIGDGPRPGSAAEASRQPGASTAPPSCITPILDIVATPEIWTPSGIDLPRGSASAVPAAHRPPRVPAAGTPPLVNSHLAPAADAYLSTKPAAATRRGVPGVTRAAGPTAAAKEVTNAATGAGANAATASAARPLPSRVASSSSAPREAKASSARAAASRSGSAVHKPKAAGFRPGGASARKGAPSSAG